MKQVWSVGRVASWAGFCLPCGQDDRPLVLTRSGASGLRAWLAGIGDDERTLLLTCRVCGEWQVVPLREEDDPEVVLQEAAPVEVPPAAAPVIGSRSVVSSRSVIGSRTVVVLPALAPLVLAPSSPVAEAADPAAVAAARSVLSAARAGQQRTTVSRSRRTSSSARRRGHRRGPTPRRPDHAARTARLHVVPVAAATSIVLPDDLLTSGHSVLVAAG